jgi:hypothetical protein
VFGVVVTMPGVIDLLGSADADPIQAQLALVCIAF